MIYPTIEHNYEFELNKDLTFSAAHYIDDEGAGKCRNIHGHNYIANITIVGNTLDKTGFLVNFSKIKEIITHEYDHQLLNEHDHFKNIHPTTETVARSIYEMIQNYLDSQTNQCRCIQVFLRETNTSYVVYRPKGVQ